MTDKRPGTKHRRHRNRSEADQLAAEYEASGLNRKEFCQQKDIPIRTLSRYVARYQRQKQVGSRPQRWVAAEVAWPSSREGGVELAVLLPGGRRIEVRRGFDAGTLRQLVAVLEQA